MDGGSEPSWPIAVAGLERDRGQRAGERIDARTEIEPTRPGFVLTMARYYGTLAATRCLGHAGVPVIVADESRFSPALWSRHVVRREHCPPARFLDRLVDWLLEFGARNPGHVLYATSDDLAWVFAERSALFSRPHRLVRRGPGC